MSTEQSPVVLVNFFEVPPSADDGFIQGWRRSLEFLRDQNGYLGSALHRSVAPDADFRFVNIAHWATPRDFQSAINAPEFPGRDLPFTAHPALYKVVSEDVLKASEGGALLINAFEVPRGYEGEFRAAWEQTRDILHENGAYLATWLHEGLSPDADFRFVNIGRYESPQAFQKALQIPAFASASKAFPFKAHPGLYQAIQADRQAIAA